MQLTRIISATLMGVDPQLTLTFRSLATQVDASLAQERLVARLSGLFSLLGLLLAGLGLYGVMAYAVTRRRKEIGIRMALGAPAARVMRLVLRRASLLVGVGLFCGTALSLWASKYVAALIYGLTPRDPATLVGSTFLLAFVAAVAAAIPALRAIRTNPARVLRED
jgi:ABC-type antimicrobial peptide transport system permease subunit